MNPDVPQPPAWLSLMPLLIYSLLFAATVLWLAPRKGKSQLMALIVLVPCVGPFIMIYLLALPDKKTLDEIAELKRRLDGK